MQGAPPRGCTNLSYDSAACIFVWTPSLACRHPNGPSHFHEIPWKAWCLDTVMDFFSASCSTKKKVFFLDGTSKASPFLATARWHFHSTSARSPTHCSMGTAAGQNLDRKTITPLVMERTRPWENQAACVPQKNVPWPCYLGQNLVQVFQTLPRNWERQLFFGVRLPSRTSEWGKGGQSRQLFCLPFSSQSCRRRWGPRVAGWQVGGKRSCSSAKVNASVARSTYRKMLQIQLSRTFGEVQILKNGALLAWPHLKVNLFRKLIGWKSAPCWNLHKKCQTTFRTCQRQISKKLFESKISHFEIFTTCFWTTTATATTTAPHQPQLQLQKFELQRNNN